MKRILYTIILFLFGIFCGITSKDSFRWNEAEEENELAQDRPDLAWELEKEKTMDPSTRDVPRERLLNAWQYAKTLMNSALHKNAIPGFQWTGRGPINNGGRTRAALVDRNDPSGKTVFVGSVGGGLWYTKDITVNSPNWTPINDFLDNLAITGITQSKVNPQVMYMCTGEAYSNSDATRGLGVWKSTNGGLNWTPLTATQNSSFYYCYKILCPSHPDTLFVATQVGLFRSSDGGATFTKVLASGISSAGGNYCYDIEVAANGTLYASMASSSSASGSIHKSYNSGTTWTNPLTLPSSISRRRIELSTCENDSNCVWAVCENTSNIKGIIKTTDAGNTWTATSAYPVDFDSGINANDFSRGQAWYDISVAVDPNNPNICYVGGVDLFRTNNGGSSWTQVSLWYNNVSYQYVHADQHLALYAPGSSTTCYFTNDGGIFQTTNANATTPVINNKGDNYTTLQFYSVAIHPTKTDYFLAGAQDNGSHLFSSPGLNSTTSASGGDGAFCHIDQDQPTYQFTSYVYSSYFSSTNGGANFINVLNNSNGRFINPSDYDNAGNVMYMATTAGNYLRWDNPQSGTTASTTTVAVSAFGSSQVSAVTVSPNVTNRVYFGAGGKIFKVDSANLSSSKTAVNLSSSSFPSGAYLNCIEVESGNESHIIVCFSNYGVNSIWESTNGGSSWTSIEGNLPDMPIRWVTINPSRSSAAFVATELGVWTCDSLKGSSSVWGPSNSGLANVRVEMLQVRKSDGLLAASTHGRGLFTSIIPNYTPVGTVFADFSPNQYISYPGASITFTNSSTGDTTYNWNFGDSTSSTLKSPTKTYTNPGYYKVKLTLNNGSASKSIYITILPYRGTPYLSANGGDFESNLTDFASDSSNGGTPFQLGKSTISGKSGTSSGVNAWVTGKSDSLYVDNSNALLYSPCFNMTAAGSYSISFYLKNSFEIGYDGLRVEYSLNRGQSWTVLGATSTSWYDFANSSATTAFPQNEPFFNALNTSYKLRSLNISSLAGNSRVCFRFVFKSDEFTTDIGCAIDNFELTGPNNNALPVNWISFSGYASNDGLIHLNWKTTQEKNCAAYVVMRSIDPNKNFEAIATVNAYSVSQSINSYNFTDHSAANDLYYKIKQLDKNGNFSYSKIIHLVTQTPLVNIVFYDAQQKNINFSPNDRVLKYTLFSLKGEMLACGSSDGTIPAHGLTPGIVIVLLQDDSGNRIVQKILIPE